jgi:hypothetical protein
MRGADNSSDMQRSNVRRCDPSANVTVGVTAGRLTRLGSGSAHANHNSYFFCELNLVTKLLCSWDSKSKHIYTCYFGTAVAGLRFD